MEGRILGRQISRVKRRRFYFERNSAELRQEEIESRVNLHTVASDTEIPSRNDYVTNREQSGGRGEKKLSRARLRHFDIPMYLTSKRFPSFPTHLPPRPIFVSCIKPPPPLSPPTASVPLPPSYPLRFPCLFIRCIRFVGLREVSRGETSSSRAEWISPDYLVAPNRSESWHNGRARIMRHMSLCRCTIAMHPPLTCLAPDHRQLDKTA